MTTSQEIIIVGAGIVGLCCAAALRRDGRKVILVDCGLPGEGASAGNAGGLSAGSVVPLSHPGVIWKIPGWILDPLGPLAIRWRYLPALAPWLLRFVASGRRERVEAQSRALRTLLQTVVETYRPIVDAAKAEHLVHQRGHLTVYNDRTSLLRHNETWAIRRRQGVHIEELGRSDLEVLAPGLSPAYAAGMLIPENGHCADPLAFCRIIARMLANDGVEIRRAAVTDFDIRSGAVSAVKTSEGDIPASAVVLAAGAWSAHLAQKLGDRIPLETQRGYSVTISEPGVAPSLPVFIGEHHIAITPMVQGLRIAGTVELAGLKARPDQRRWRKLLSLGRQAFPALREAPDSELSFWMGHRPCLPDSLPVIGAASRAYNAFHAFGHGHVGLAGAALTSVWIAELLAGRPPPADLTPFSPRRFR